MLTHEIIPNSRSQQIENFKFMNARKIPAVFAKIPKNLRNKK